jgi:hypothetical protein
MKGRVELNRFPVRLGWFGQFRDYLISWMVWVFPFLRDFCASTTVEAVRAIHYEQSIVAEFGYSHYHPVDVYPDVVDDIVCNRAGQKLGEGALDFISGYAFRMYGNHKNEGELRGRLTITHRDMDALHNSVLVGYQTLQLSQALRKRYQPVEKHSMGLSTLASN